MDELPICKVALDARQRCLLRDEFSILRHLASHNTPAVRTHPQPLTDENGVFGFRMERLVDINIEIASDYISDIENAINAIHQCGVVLHDISSSNIMLNQLGYITIIGFGRAGYVGEIIPSCKTLGVKPLKEVFSVNADRVAMSRTIRMYGPFKTILLQLTLNS
jgi:serine/threonine protein kinase